MANGSLHMLHFLRSFSTMSGSGVSSSCVGALAPALFLISFSSSPFTGASYFRHSSHMSVPLLRMPSEHVEHFQTVIVGASQMAHLPFRACIWHCAPHSGHCLILSGGPGFFASPILILHCCISFRRRFSNHHVIEDVSCHWNSHRT